jgi:DNA invertase Pin-like site-specific DNA recombinase
MARTSRKGAALQAAIPAERVWNAAVYARLSLEDSGRKGADTIDTQIELVSSYVAQRPYLSLADTYVDNGESGKDFDRPAWNRLMDDIRGGRVDCVCVKDLSRFSRNYIETCEFLEKIFPFMGVRFVSVNDGYDNNNPDSRSEGLLVALKALVNDQYLRDISRKICSSVKARRERGAYTGSFAPFGYRKVDGQKGKLEPDEETAPIIREIFEWRAAGVSHLAICKRLDERGTLTPNERLRRERGIFRSDFFKATIWREATIKGMIRSRVYIGCLEQGKHEQRLYEHKPCTPVPESDWIITENAHEPIVSRELWEAANAVEAAARESHADCVRKGGEPENIFRGFTVCGICGAKIPRLHNKKTDVYGHHYEYYIYTCPLKRQHPAEPVYRSIRAEALYDAVFTPVAEELQRARNLGAIIEKRSKRQANPRAALDAEINRAARELETINQRLAKLYENYADKLLTEMEYIGLKAEYERRAESVRSRTEDLSRRAALVSDVSESNNRWLSAARAFQNPTELTREMLEAVVERIEVYDPGTVKIIYKYKDEFEMLKSCAEADSGEEEA